MSLFGLTLTFSRAALIWHIALAAWRLGLSPGAALLSTRRPWP